MASRILAPTFGVIAGVVVAGFCLYAWNDALALARVTAPAMVAPLSLPLNRAAWAIAGAIGAFAVVAQATALAAGILETILTRRRIAALAPDWQAVFAGASIARAAATPGGRQDKAGWRPSPRLESIWLDELSIARLTAPLATLALAAGGLLALFSDISGTGWEMALAAGLCGWLLISLARYLAVVVLSPLVASTITAIAEAVRTAAAPAARVNPSPDPEAIARELADILAEPLERLADAADRLGSAEPPPSRERPIDAALADIRAGIERLLAASPNH
jgi:hypothetical protein